MCEQYTQLPLSAPQMKRCRICGLTKSLAEYHRDRNKPDGYEPRCKVCRSHRGPDEYAQRIERRAAGLKRCTKCDETKPLADFNKQVSQPDGHQCYCRACMKGVNAAQYGAKREERNARSQADYRANIERYRVARKAAYAATREQSIAAAVAWNRANPDKRYVTTEKWRKANMERTREYVRRRYARRKAGRIAPFTLAQLQAKMDYWANRCHLCGAPADTIDHVKPLAKGGLDVLANLRPCCGHCNSSKRDRWPYPLTRNIPRWQ